MSLTSSSQVPHILYLSILNSVIIKLDKVGHEDFGFSENGDEFFNFEILSEILIFFGCGHSKS